MQIRNIFAFAILVALLVITRPTRGAVLAGPFVDPANGHNYSLLSANSWTGAEAEAVTLGGHLATVDNQAENDWIYNTFLPYVSSPTGSLLIGFTDPTQDGQFVWTSGAPTIFTHWGSGEPNNISSEIYTNLELHDFNSILAGQWNDITNGSSSLPQYGVVEAVPEPGSIGFLAFAGVIMYLRLRRPGLRDVTQ